MDTVFRQPLGNVNSDVTLLVLGGSCWPGTVIREFRNLNLITFTTDHLGRYFLYKFRSISRYGFWNVVSFCGLTKLNLNDVLDGAVNSVIVHLDNFIAFLTVGLLDGIFNGFDGLIFCQNSRDQEKCGLHNHVDASAEAKGCA